MLWASSQLPGSPGGGVFSLVPGFGPVPAALGLVPCSEGLPSVVMQEQQVLRVPRAAQGIPHPQHTARGLCSFHKGPWNIFPVNLSLGNPEHRWRICTYSEDKPKPMEFPRDREAPQEISPITGGSEVLVQLCRSVWWRKPEMQWGFQGKPVFSLMPA